MPKLEKKVWTWFCDHILFMLIILSVLISLAIRYSMRNYISGDMESYLLPWYEEIKNKGGILALGTPVGNYNMPYQALIALLTYIPFTPEYLYKFSSSIFDFIQALFVFLIIKDITKEKLIACLAFAISINLPIVLMNSALWGQCDSIYSSFCIISLYCSLHDRYTRSLIFMGVAFAFKLQAVFFLPFLLFVYVHKKRFSCLYFFYIPFMMVILSLGG